jgi:DNA-binding HxlR family transcriptional regulator
MDGEDRGAGADPEELGRRLREASPVGRRLFVLLGRSGALETLYEVGARGPIRFGELKDRLAISSATLSARLSELVDAGFVERTSYDEMPPRVEYAPTERLVDLKPALVHLVDWAERHGFEANDAGTGRASDPDRNER